MDIFNNAETELGFYIQNKNLNVLSTLFLDF